MSEGPPKGHVARRPEGEAEARGKRCEARNEGGRGSTRHVGRKGGAEAEASAEAAVAEGSVGSEDTEGRAEGGGASAEPPYHESA